MTSSKSLGSSGPAPSENVQTLADAIMRHKRLYYAGTPEISDPAYDKMEAALKRLAPDHPALSFVGTDTTAARDLGKKAEHDLPMLSLEKTYDREELTAWVEDRPIVGSWKIDGASISLVYAKGRLDVAKTRGNGRVGEMVTEKLNWVADVPRTLPESIGKKALLLEVRGELLCTESRFLQLSDEMVALGLDRPTSPRNIVAGLLGRKEHIDLCRYFSFYAFDVIVGGKGGACPLFSTEMEKVALLRELGFAIPGTVRLESTREIDAFLTSVRDLAEDGEIGVDGAVFSLDDLQLHAALGETSHHPRYKLSFKWAGQTAISRIESITWATSRLGIVTPVAVIEPVALSGASITNITLHNAAHVKAYNLKPGDRIELIRSGEVIPKFLSVQEAGPGHFVWPNACPSCDAPLTFDDVRLHCSNALQCPAQKSGAVLNWIKAAEIEDISEKRLGELMDRGLVTGIADLYRLTVEDFLQLPQTKTRMAEKLFGNIQSTKTLPLARFLLGLGIEGMGRTSWEKLIAAVGDLGELRKARAEDVAGIDGSADLAAAAVVEGLAAKAPLIDELLEAGVSPVYIRPKEASQGGALPLAGKLIAITGSLTRPREEVEEAIRQAGGQPTSSVSKNTFVLVAEDPESKSSKMTKARALGIPIWSEMDLQKFLDQTQP